MCCYTAIAPPRLEQLAFADFLLRGELDRHLRRMRLRYRRRRDVLVRSSRGSCRRFGCRGLAAGLYVEAVLPAGLDERASSKRRGRAESGSPGWPSIASWPSASPRCFSATR